MKSWRVDLTAGGKTLAEVKIQKGILSLFLFVTVRIPLNHILWKYSGGDKFTNS